MCKPFTNEYDSVAVQPISKDADNNNNNSQLAANDINCNNSNSQTKKESNKNIFSLLPKDIFLYIIDLFTLDGSSINHSAQGKPSLMILK